MFILKPNEWGFKGRYYYENEILNSNNRFSTLVKDELTMTTDRLRCGYIENSFIVLSPRKEDADRAYLEIDFDKPVYSFMISVCLWSSVENLDGIAILQVKNFKNNWTTLTDLKTLPLTT